MRYFTYIAEQSFKNDNEGHRLFYLGTPFSRPYLIPDEATEAKLFWRMAWYYRIFLSIMILGQPFLFRFFIPRPWLFYAYLAAMVAVQWVILRLVFNSIISKLNRAPTRLSLRTFYLNMAQRHSETALFLGLVACIAFVAIGLFMCFLGSWALALGILPVVFFGACAVGWGYALHLKQTTECL